MGVDLTSRYLGLTLRSPLVAAPSPITGDLDVLQTLEGQGVGAVVLPSLFEEQLEHESLAVHGALSFGAESFAEAADGYLPELDAYNCGPAPYVRLVEAARARLEVPVIASLNGTSKGGWVSFAKDLESAGASALELNLYLIPTDPDRDAETLEARYEDLVRAVREAVSIPLAVKLTPFFTSLPHLAKRLVAAGADGLVLFNRFLQPDIDLETLEVATVHRLSTPHEMLLRLRWIALLKGRVQASLAASGGAHRAKDALKLLLAGADVVQMAAALLKHGPRYIRSVLSEMEAWLTEREYASVEQLKGSLSQGASPDPDAYERGQYMKALLSYCSDEQAPPV